MFTLAPQKTSIPTKQLSIEVLFILPLDLPATSSPICRIQNSLISVWTLNPPCRLWWCSPQDSRRPRPLLWPPPLHLSPSKIPTLFDHTSLPMKLAHLDPGQLQVGSPSHQNSCELAPKHQGHISQYQAAKKDEIFVSRRETVENLFFFSWRKSPEVSPGAITTSPQALISHFEF